MDKIRLFTKSRLASLLFGTLLLIMLTLISSQPIAAKQHQPDSTLIEARQILPNDDLYRNPAIQQTFTQTVVQSGTGVDLPAPTIKPLASMVALQGITHDWQLWNNCGPVTITMNLSYFGRTETQLDSAPFLKPNQDDLNVSPHELVAYAQTLGYKASVQVGGDLMLLKTLLSNDFPIIVETWLDPSDYGGYGHYRLFTGYNEAEGHFIAHDSLNGFDIVVPFAEFDAFWQVFNRTYVVVYPQEKSDVITAILGSQQDDRIMLKLALRTAQDEVIADLDNAYAWFNMGTNYARLGMPHSSAYAFDKAQEIGLPYRMLWYQFDIFETYLALERYEDVINIATRQLRATGGLEEFYYYRGQARLALGQRDLAIRDFQAAVNYNQNYRLPIEALESLDGT
ncbi:MAG: C39 family peptidase [Chloroflexota bacterium]